MKTNTPNPLVPQGSMPDKRGKSHVRIAVFTILAVHAVLLGALLLQGCKPTTTTDMVSNVETNYPPPPIDTSSAPPLVSSLPPETSQATQVPPPVIEQPQFTQNTSSPPIPPPLEVAPPPTGYATEHVVVAHDVYSKIARKYNVTVKALVEANPGVNPTRLRIGQKLVIPAPTAPSTAAAPINGGSSSGQTTYTVRSGDNLMKIARTHGTTVKALRSANRLKTDQIKVGQKLLIPGKNGAPESGLGGTSTAPQTLPVP